MMDQNLVIGTEIEWTEGVFAGSHRRPKYVGDRKIHGVVLKESYGEKKGQHTFTIKVLACEGMSADEGISKGKILRKGRNVYPSLTVISQPEDYSLLAEQKRDRSTSNKIIRGVLA